MNSLAVYESDSSAEDSPHDDDDDDEARLAPAIMAHSTNSASPSPSQHPASACDIARPKRIRTFAHVDGNWATSIYAPVSLAMPWYDAIDLLCETLQAVLPIVEPTAPADLHISLSKVFPIRIHLKDALEVAVRRVVKQSPTLMVEFGAPEILQNDDKTRTFVVLPVTMGLSVTRALVDLLDNILTTFDLPCFYAERRIHLSVASAVGDHKELLQSESEKLRSEFTYVCVHQQPTHLRQVVLKVGHLTIPFALP